MKPLINYKEHPIPFHIAFWVGYFLVGLSIFLGAYPWQQAVQRVSIGMFFHAFLIYVNVYWAFPRFFREGFYIGHYLILASLVLITSWLRVKLDIYLKIPNEFVNLEYGTLSHYGTKILAGALILSFSSSFRYLEDYLERVQLEQELKNYKLEAELKLLKAQINPHFLFNSLNNIYSMAVTNTRETAPMILKLSEMMRYMLYESNEERVQLTKEIGYLNNYIALQQLKTERPQSIVLDIEGHVEGVTIAPMLLIPFWENSIKHGNVHHSPDAWVRGRIAVQTNLLVFELRNTMGVGGSKDVVGGIGLVNVHKRLKMLYKDQYKLDIEETENLFSVHLEIELP